AGPAGRWAYSDTGVLSAVAARSIRGFTTAAFSIELPEAARGRLRSALAARWLDAPEVPFYGLGPGSSREDRALFHYRFVDAGGEIEVRAAGALALCGGLGVLAAESGSGRTPAIEERFDAEAAPGLGAAPRYRLARAEAAVDWRDSPGYTRRGGLYRLAWSDYRDGRGAWSFRRWDAELVQHVPLVRANWVLAFRALASTTTPQAGARVPFFLMPSLGGGSDLRAFDSFRFRDRHRLLLTAEYRWTPSYFLDMALFADAGTVAARRRDLDLHRLRLSYGIGARLHGPSATALRLELARGAEGLRLVVTAGAPF
ncbi:MAG TPA: BamA/TamA family outer membrane protein, partial [Vicinamibacterales bacterium]|nr:BamA/TamA family outer membrane protein [Vicinamibacterales bacterium]